MPHGRGFILATTSLSVAVFLTVIFWLTSGVGIGESGVSSDDAGVASLIQQRTNKFSEQKQQISSSLEETASQAGEIVGVLHIGSEYRRSDVTVVLEKISFYDTQTIVTYHVTNQSERDIELNPSRARIKQIVSGSGASIELTEQSKTDQTHTIAPGESQNVRAVFAPFNGREPFTVWTGTLQATDGQQEPWEARFEVSAQEITG